MMATGKKASPSRETASSLTSSDHHLHISNHHLEIHPTDHLFELNASRLADPSKHDAGLQLASCSPEMDSISVPDSVKSSPTTGGAVSQLDSKDTESLHETAGSSCSSNTNTNNHDINLQPSASTSIELRFLVRRREAGALIGKRGSNIKRLRDTFRSSMLSIPDSGNGPERVVCIVTDAASLDPILSDLTKMLMEKSPENDSQIELRLLIHSSHAGSIIGIGGQSIKKLRNDSRAAIKIFEMCCPLSNERVCAIKAKPPVVVSTIKLIQIILAENPVKGTVKPYDALHFDINLVDKYGGYLPEEPLELMAGASNSYDLFGRSVLDSFSSKHHFPLWASASCPDLCESLDGLVEPANYSGKRHHHSHHQQQQQQQQHPHPHSHRRALADNQQEASAGYRNNKRRAPEDATCHEASAEDKSSPRSVSHSTRVVRYHPYNQTTNRPTFLPSSGGVGSSTHQRPVARPTVLNRCQTHFNQQEALQHYWSSHYSRMQALLPAQQASRCQHSRPCLCMFLPMMSDNLQPSTPYPLPMTDNGPNGATTHRNATQANFRKK